MSVVYFQVSQCKPSKDPNSDCMGAQFVKSDGKFVYPQFEQKVFEIFQNKEAHVS